MTADAATLIEQARAALDKQATWHTGHWEDDPDGETRTWIHDENCAICVGIAALDSLASLVAEREAELAHFVSAVESIEKVCVNEPDAVTAATRAADIARGVLAFYSPEVTGAA